jgi:hypothetical protein
MAFCYHPDVCYSTLTHEHFLYVYQCSGLPVCYSVRSTLFLAVYHELSSMFKRLCYTSLQITATLPDVKFKTQDFKTIHINSSWHLIFYKMDNIVYNGFPYKGIFMLLYFYIVSVTLFARLFLNSFSFCSGVMISICDYDYIYLTYQFMSTLCVKIVQTTRWVHYFTISLNVTLILFLLCFRVIVHFITLKI